MENKKNNKELVKFLSKVAIGVVASAMLTPPAALYIGGWTFFTAKCVECMIEKEEDKEDFRFIADCGKDIAFDGLIDCLVGTEAFSSASEATHSIGKEASKEIATNGITDLARELIEKGREISELQKIYKTISKIKDRGIPTLELIKHKIHLDQGINYLEDCEVCNV